MRIIKTIGNQKLLEREKTLFLCSKHTPIELYWQVFQWVDGLSERECIVCFSSTEMEEEVMKALVVNEVPTILVVMNLFGYLAKCKNPMLSVALTGNGLLPIIIPIVGQI